MHIGDFDFYREFFYRQAGITLSPDQTYLLMSRLKPVAAKWDYPDLRAMTMAMRGVPQAALVADVIEAMAEGDASSFFADPALFEDIRARILPELVRASPKHKIRIWCAGCATGQDAYTLAFLAHEYMQAARCAGFEIFATDLSRAAIARARSGKFSQYEIQQGLPTAMAMNCMIHEGQTWQVIRPIFNMITFEPFNLLHDMGRLGRFDLIVCRTAMTGFDEELKDRVTRSFKACLKKDGRLMA